MSPGRVGCASMSIAAPPWSAPNGSAVATAAARTGGNACTRLRIAS